MDHLNLKVQFVHGVHRVHEVQSKLYDQNSSISMYNVVLLEKRRGRIDIYGHARFLRKRMSISN